MHANFLSYNVKKRIASRRWVKVKFTLEQAVKAQVESRDIDLLFL